MFDVLTLVCIAGLLSALSVLISLWIKGFERRTQNFAQASDQWWGYADQIIALLDKIPEEVISAYGLISSAVVNKKHVRSTLRSALHTEIESPSQREALMQMTPEARDVFVNACNASLDVVSAMRPRRWEKLKAACLDDPTLMARAALTAHHMQNSRPQ